MLMNASAPRRDFANTLLASPPGPTPASAWRTRIAVVDPLEPMMAAERADRALLRLVAVIAGAALAGALLTALL